jgi:peroxiredoxin
MKKVLLTILAIVISAALTITACASTSCPEIGKAAPDFTLKTIHGDSLNLNDFQGKPLLINFWAMNCTPCLSEMPLIQSVYDKWSNQGLVVLAINIRDSAPATSKFISAKGFTFAVLIDIGAKVFHSYCLPEAIPVTLLISAEGNLMAKKVGNFRSLDEIESFLLPCMPTQAAQLEHGSVIESP